MLLMECKQASPCSGIGGISDFRLCRFLLARLTFESLVGHKKLKAIKDTMGKLSRGADSLDSAYDNTMKRIEEQDQHSRELAIRTLSWITQGQRVLSVKEIQQAVSIELEYSDLDSESTVHCDDIISACAGLVTRVHDSPHKEILRLVHYTTQEYLERTKTKYFPEAQKYLASSCLTYLLFDVFSGALCLPGQDNVPSHGRDTGVKTDTKEVFCFGCKKCWNAEQHDEGCRVVDLFRKDPCSDLRNEQYPFYEYAVWYWGHHAENCDDEAIRILTTSFLDDARRVSGAFRHVAKYYLPHGNWRLKHNDFNPGSAMQLAAFLGLTKVVYKLLEDGLKPDIKDWSDVTPLSWAVDRGHEQVVNLLMTREDVDPNARERNGRTPLVVAAINGNIAIVKLLLACENIELNSKDELKAFQEWSLLSKRLYKDQNGLQILKLLLACEDIDFNVLGSHFKTPLMMAIRHKSVGGLQLFLAREDIQVNAKDGFGGPALHLAVIYYSVEVMRLLLAREDIQVNVTDNQGSTALHVAAAYSKFEAVQLLLARDDLEVNATDKNGKSALFCAVKNFHCTLELEMAELFLARGDVDLNIRDMDGYTPLYHAVRSGLPDVVQLLLTREDLEISIEDGEGERLVSLAEDERDKAKKEKKDKLRKLQRTRRLMEMDDSNENDDIMIRIEVKSLEKGISRAEAHMEAYERTIDALRSYIQQTSSNTTSEDIMQLNAQLLAHIHDDNDDEEEEEEEE